MRALVLFVALGLLFPVAQAQHTDTLRFRSDAFGTQRSVVVHLPEFHRYASAQVRMPVFILLDGQHEWFIDPLLNDIRYMQYTNMVPQAIVVVVPHEDRVEECAPGTLDRADMPLLRMIADELPPMLTRYNPGDVRVLVGHSFTASFALYAFVRRPEAFNAVIALSPLDLVDRSLPRVAELLAQRTDRRVLVAVGGEASVLDGGHHAKLTSIVAGLDIQRTGGRLSFREYPSASHTSLPIIAFPEMASTLFLPFRSRDALFEVDMDTGTISAPPPPPDELMRHVEASWAFLGGTLPGELAEINGMLSLLYESAYAAHVLTLSRKAVHLFPKYFLFHAWLGEALLDDEPATARKHLHQALELLDRYERTEMDYREMRGEIEGLLEE